MPEEWKNLVYISIIGKHQTKSDIARAWDVSINGGPLYQENVKKDIEELIDNNLIEKRGPTLYADLESREFEERLKKFIEDLKKENDNSKLEEYILDNFEEYLELIRKEEIRREIFDLETMVKICGEDVRTGKQMPMFKPFQIFYNNYSPLFVPKFLDHFRDSNQGEIIADSFKAMFESYSEKLMENSGYHPKPFVENLEKFEEKNGEIEFLMKTYEQTSTQNLPDRLNFV